MITIDVQDHVSAEVNRFIGGLVNRRPLHARIGRRVHSAVRRHTLKWARSHHKTSARLGATPSNFVAAAAEAVESSPPIADGESATVRLPHPFYARAFGPVDIKPPNVYLTIPLVAAAYNQRAYRVKGLFFFKSKSGKAFLAESIKAPGTKGTLVLWYLLVTGVHQSQERARLPADEELFDAAMLGVESYMKTLEGRQGATESALPDL